MTEREGLELGHRDRGSATLLTCGLVLFASGCVVERGGLGFSPPDAGRRDVGIDAPVDAPDLSDVPVDVGSDTGADSGSDAGGPCSNGVLDDGETDVDCGGACPPCSACSSCVVDADCASGQCAADRCRPTLTRVPTADGTMIPAFVREDGAILLARYPAGMPNPHPYDPSLSLALGHDSTPADWAPDPCFEAGHLPFANLDPTEKTVVVECGDGDSTTSYSTDLFESFEYGTFGSVGAEGNPGWATLAANGSGSRHYNYLCGNASWSTGGGFALCSGEGETNSFANHLASISVYSSGINMACAGRGCRGDACDVWINIWMR